MSAFFCSRGTCNGKLHFQVHFLMQRYHNLKGFDGMFIIKELYEQQRQVTEQLSGYC